MRTSTLGLVLVLTACGASPDATYGANDGVGGAEATGGSTGGDTAAGATGGATASGGTMQGTGAAGASATGGSGHGTGGMASTGGSATVTGQPGVWEDVTPAGIHLAPDYDPAGNFGVQDVLADPAHPGTFYAFVCYQGVWKTTDFGTSWARVDTDGNLEQGRPWGQAMAPDGSYMLACTGYGTARWGAWKSTDDGTTWQKYPIADNSDPYMFDIDPADRDHVLSTSHSVGSIYESTDAGQSWNDKGDGGVGHSGYVFFITSTTWLLVAQSGAGGTRRTTNSGASWQHVGEMEHVHGGEQIYVDPMSGHIYVPSHSMTNGIFRSTDDGASFHKVSDIQSAAVFATETTLYSLDSGANLGGNTPKPASAGRADGASWTPMGDPPEAMTNGAKRGDVSFAAETDRWVAITGNWNAGIWRYIED